MAPILGIWASQGRVPATSFESIATVTVGSGGSASVEFTSIPSDYVHLQVRISARNSRTGNNQANGFFEVNNDTNINNYTYHLLSGNGSSASASGAGTGNYTGLSTIFPSADLTTNLGVAIYDFLDYKNTNKYKTVRCLNGWDGNGSGTLYYSSNLWLSTSAITSIKFTIPGYNWTQYSHFALYGIKGL
jgi:hypothetical protein